MVNHIQSLTDEQDLYIHKIKLALKNKTKANHNKPKAVQKIIDYCIKNNILPEEIIK